MADDRKADVWMPILIDRYLGDTSMLTTEEHGAYLLLLMTAWKSGGALPDDDGKLARAAKLTPSRWKRVGENVRAFFRSDGHGGLVQKRLTIELKRAKQRSEAGTKGAAVRWRNDSESDAERHGETGSEPDANRDGESDANGMRIGMADSPPFPPVPLSPQPLPLPLSPSLSPLRSESAGRAPAISPGEACKAMREAGLAEVNPSNPTLRTMLDQGITLAELADAARVAVATGKGFAWALMRAAGMRADAAKVQLAPPSKTAQQLAAMSAAVAGRPSVLDMTPEERQAYANALETRD